jgi:hypothetical protein
MSSSKLAMVQNIYIKMLHSSMARNTLSAIAPKIRGKTIGSAILGSQPSAASKPFVITS